MKFGNLPPFFAIVREPGEAKRLLQLLGYKGDEYRYLAVHTCGEVPERAYGFNEWHVDAPLYWLTLPRRVNRNGLMGYHHELEALRDKLLYQLEHSYHTQRHRRNAYALPSGLVLMKVKPPFISTITGEYPMADLSVDDLSCIAQFLGRFRMEGQKISSF
jgi:hypothetical protein